MDPATSDKKRDQVRPMPDSRQPHLTNNEFVGTHTHTGNTAMRCPLAFNPTYSIVKFTPRKVTQGNRNVDETMLPTHTAV